MADRPLQIVHDIWVDETNLDAAKLVDCPLQIVLDIWAMALALKTVPLSAWSCYYPSLNQVSSGQKVKEKSKNIKYRRGAWIP